MCNYYDQAEQASEMGQSLDDDKEKHCVVCGEQIFWNGRRWAGVYIMTDGDVCLDMANELVRADHTPEDETPEPGYHSVAVDRVSDIETGTEDNEEFTLRTKSVVFVSGR